MRHDCGSGGESFVRGFVVVSGVVVISPRLDFAVGIVCREREVRFL